MGKFSLLRDTDKASWPKIRPSSCVLNQGPTCALALASRCACQPLYLTSGSSLFGWILTSMFFSWYNQKAVTTWSFVVVIYTYGMANPEEQQVYLLTFRKPPHSITVTQAMYGEFSLHPSLYPSILKLLT